MNLEAKSVSGRETRYFCVWEAKPLQLRMLKLSFLLIILLISTAAVPVFSADRYRREDFPPGFIFGAAYEDGRSSSIWDAFAHEGNEHGDTGDVAIDEYHKYKEDVQIMAQTGLDAYRFSISWSRLIPNGRGPVNPKGLQYYNHFVNELIAHGIQPHALLCNYDHPQALEDEYGGWISRKIVKDFTAYADVCFREFGDRVSHWTTVNEPNEAMTRGWHQLNDVLLHLYLTARKATLHLSPTWQLTICCWHTHQLQDYTEKRISLYIFRSIPLTNLTADVAANQRAQDFLTGWIADPLMFGDYPSTMKRNVGSRLPEFTNHESKLVKGSFDFIGLIHYNYLYVEDNSVSLKEKNRDFNRDMGVKLYCMLLITNTRLFEIRPRDLQQILENFKSAYGNPPIYIQENGQKTRRGSSLEDPSRVKYLHAYIGSVLDAIRNGSNTRGYFVWSLWDGLELLDGYESSYGLYYVDLDDPDLKRYPKLSAHWYSHFLKGRGVSLDGIIELEKNLSGVSKDASFSRMISM
uniref:Beta-glucosidase n=1 Tax=Salix viminalis TaxID=40686 RepID=A0A6N2MZ15_SALVM